MAGILGGVFANGNQHYPMWRTRLDPIDEGVSRRDDEPSASEPAVKRLKTAFCCEHCGETFTEKRSLVRHLRAKCEREEQPLRLFHCAFCAKTFSRDDVKQRHENEKHHKIKRRQRNYNIVPQLHHSHEQQQHVLSVPIIPDSKVSATSATAVIPTYQVTRKVESHNDRGCDAASNYSLSPSAAGSSNSESQYSTTSILSTSGNVKHRRWSSSAGSESSSGSSLRLSATNTSLTSYSSDVGQSLVSPRAASSDVNTPDNDGWLPARRVSFDRLPRRDVVKAGASARPASQLKSRVCPLCSRQFGHTEREVRAHVDQHCLAGEGQHKCNVCWIGFTHKADLELHMLNARQGTCGFSFHHLEQCTGHHPPHHGQASMSDHDRMRLSCLQHWEQCQLQGYSAIVADVIAYVSSREDSWSIDAAFAKSVQSLSILFSGLDIRSTPEFFEQHVRTVMHRVRRRVSNKVPFGPDASLKIKVGKKSANDVRLGKALMEAAATGDMNGMKGFISRGAPINNDYIVGDEIANCTPLIAAICGGHLEAVDLLLERGAVADGLSGREDSNVATPLCWAATLGFIDIVRSLLSHGANVNKLSMQGGGHAACHAARNGHTNILSLLLKHGADVHQLAVMELLPNDDARFSKFLSRGNILAIAVHNDHLSTVEMLLKRPEIDFDYCDISAAVSVAAYQGNLAMVTLLLRAHAELCTFFALWIADCQGHRAVCDRLVEHQRQLRSRTCPATSKRLYVAIQKGYKDLTSLMLSPPDSTNELLDQHLYDCRAYESNTAYDLIVLDHLDVRNMLQLKFAMALNCAVFYGDLESAELLLKAGLDANALVYPARCRWLATNISLASRLGNSAMVQTLMQRGAKSGSPYITIDLLEAALESGSIETVRVLLSAEKTISVKRDEWSCSSFNAVVQNIVKTGSTELLQTLIHAGLDVNQLQLEDGSMRPTTLLHLAAESVRYNADLKTIMLLLESGADTRTRVSSQTPSDILFLRRMRTDASNESSSFIQRALVQLEYWERRAAIGR